MDKFPEVVSRLKGVLERFADALSCIDQCFIADDMLEQLPAASQVGNTMVGGIDLNKTRMRAVVEAVIALSASPDGFTASDIAAPRAPALCIIRPPPCRLRSQKATRQAHRLPHRLHSPL